MQLALLVCLRKGGGCYFSKLPRSGFLAPFLEIRMLAFQSASNGALGHARLICLGYLQRLSFFGMIFL